MRKKKVLKIIFPAVFIVAAVIVLYCVISNHALSSNKNLKGKVIGYLPYYSTEYIDSVDFSAITHLNIAFTNPDENGRLYNNIGEETLKNIVKKCHDNNVYAIASFGGGAISSTNYNKLMRNNPSGIQEINKKILDYVNKYDLDGVDIDFEFIASSPAWEYFEDWMIALRKMCDKNNLILSAAVASWYGDNITDKAMDCFDYICVMAYDNNASSENHSLYDYAVKEMQYYTEQRSIEKKRLVLGVPFYGYKYTDSGEMDWNSGASYRYILSKDNGAKNGDYSNGYAYNGPDTIKQKAEFSLEYGGIMCWELSQDADGKDSLLSVIKKVYS